MHQQKLNQLFKGHRGGNVGGYGVQLLQQHGVESGC
jgi:hypothetical protein